VANISGGRRGMLKVLPDSRITAITESISGRMLIGSWENGLHAFDANTSKITKIDSVKADYIYSLISDKSSSSILVGTYGNGLIQLGSSSGSSARTKSRNTKQIPAVQLEQLAPADAKAPPVAQRLFNAQLDFISKTPKPRNAQGNLPIGAQAVYLGEDWMTLGDWFGNYGRFYHTLCGMAMPFDDRGAIGAYAVVSGYIGESRKKVILRPGEDCAEHIRRALQGNTPPQLPLANLSKEQLERLRKQNPRTYRRVTQVRKHWEKLIEQQKNAPKPAPSSVEAKPKVIDDVLRRWIHWLYTDNPKVLYLPVFRQSKDRKDNRRHAEWDDHAEAYSRSWLGPHLYFDLRIGEGKQDHDGVYVLSLYFMNKDGHQGNNRFRDYRITVKPLVKPFFGSAKKPGWEALFNKLPTLAEARLHDFRGGVYQRFLLREGQYTVRIHKSGSFNTVLSGVFIDKVHGKGGRVKPTFDPQKDPAVHGPGG